MMVNVSVQGGNATMEERVRYELRNLEGDGTYEVQVAALTAVGAGPRTDTVTAVVVRGWLPMTPEKDQIKW